MKNPRKRQEEKQKERKEINNTKWGSTDAFSTSQGLLLESVITFELMRWVTWTRWVIHF